MAPRLVETAVRVQRAPLRGVFRISYSSAAVAETIVVEARLSSGTLGLGEGSPAPRVTGETLEASLSYARKVAEKLRGLRLPEQLGEALRVIHSASPCCPAARAALEGAVAAAAAAEAGMGLPALLHGAPGRLVTDYTVSIPPGPVLEELRSTGYSVGLAETVEYLVGIRSTPPEEPAVPLPRVRGFTVLKVKLGTGNPELDTVLAAAVYEASRGRARIRVDANQAWSPATAAWVVKRLERVMGDDLELVEQPVPAWLGAEGLWRVRERTGARIAADEAAVTMGDIARLAASGAVDVVNIKLSKIGGPVQAAQAARLLEAHGIEAMWGCMVETGLGVAHAAIAAAASGNAAYVDLDSPLFLEDDPGATWLHYLVEPGKGVAVEATAPTGKKD